MRPEQPKRLFDLDQLTDAATLNNGTQRGTPYPGIVLDRLRRQRLPVEEPRFDRQIDAPTLPAAPLYDGLEAQQGAENLTAGRRYVKADFANTQGEFGPLYMPCQFRLIGFDGVELARFQLPGEALLADVDFEVSVVNRGISNPRLPGPITEITSREAVEFSLDGVILGADGHFPLEEMRAMKVFFDRASAEGRLLIDHAKLNALGVYEVLIKGLSLPDSPGTGQHRCDYTLRGQSDHSFTYKLIL